MMPQATDLSRVCASALLDAYCRDDAPQMNEIASEVRTIGTFYASDYAEAERLELLGGIAFEMHRSFSLGTTQRLDPYIKLLLHLVNPEWVEGCLAHRD